ncbi:fungal-specific transcription factor domain-domain-containing protein [Protomyces lactucae-debilis]|uniref:Fungal-specific transcription factor domain-domain-containing protein n=1 Tax=Protomyces lactucae-debilis TaxID=2754530 RepID=A0A1Y2F2X1_PROLT|nr:fungal-specific transcription factor domain-containing protein [Protomyces lactucae-debilis]ORY78212.1 fungal-specific transcription factor domain-domain-containing protein [Protomyces lactucae-debilis]
MAKNDQYESVFGDSSAHSPSDHDPRPRKRQRTACDRCKTRKQKCDHVLPSCGNCAKAGLECTRAPPPDPSGPSSAYTRSLEEQVARLEAQLALSGEPLPRRSTDGQTHTTGQGQGHGDEASNSVAEIVGALSGRNVAGTEFYIGTTSGYSLARDLSEMASAVVWDRTVNVQDYGNVDGDDRLSPINIAELQRQTLEIPSDALSARLINAYIGRIHGRFPVVFKSDLWDLHARRQSLFSQNAVANNEHGFSKFMLLMVYAIAGLNLRLTEDYTEPSPELFYIQALKHITAARASSAINNIQAMVLLMLYHMRSDARTWSTWHMAGLAMRTTTELGLHREASTAGLKSRQVQQRRCLFWTMYYLEGVLASTLGRPPSLIDTDIDQPMPYSIDESELDTAKLVVPESGREAFPYSSMTQSILLQQLRRLESRMQRTVLRVDVPIATLLPELYPVYESLQHWQRHSIPPEMQGLELDRPLLFYNKLIRMLLQPFLTLTVNPNINTEINLGPDKELLKQCLESAGTICQIHKRLHQSPEYGHTFVTVHTVYVAGLTLLYCLWLGGEQVWSFGVSNNIRACSFVLSIMGERAPYIRRYRDSFEGLVEATMTKLERPNALSGMSGKASFAQIQQAQQTGQPPPVSQQQHPQQHTQQQAPPTPQEPHLPVPPVPNFYEPPNGLSMDPEMNPYWFEGLTMADDGAWNMARELAGWIDSVEITGTGTSSVQ